MDRIVESVLCAAVSGIMVLRRANKCCLQKRAAALKKLMTPRTIIAV